MKPIENEVIHALLQQDYPLHSLGDTFFMMSTIEDENSFSGIHSQDFYELVWFTHVEPNQHILVDFIARSITDNQISLLLPGQIHDIEQAHKQGFIFSISRDFFEKLIGNEIQEVMNFSKNHEIIIPDSKVQVLETLTQLIRIEYEGDCRPAILESYFRSWILHCVELQKKDLSQTPKDSRVQLLQEYIEIHYKNQRHADFYARKLSISAKRLNELARDSFGKTIHQLINDRLIEEAKQKIGHFEKPIKEISYELGFSEPAYFTRFFGKQTGYAPQAFRKRMATTCN